MGVSMLNKEELYKPVVPKWVGEILRRQQQQDPFSYHGKSKEWDEWKRKYSRKLKYARLNGWTIEGEEKK